MNCNPSAAALPHRCPEQRREGESMRATDRIVAGGSALSYPAGAVPARGAAGARRAGAHIIYINNTYARTHARAAPRGGAGLAAMLAELLPRRTPPLSRAPQTSTTYSGWRLTRIRSTTGISVRRKARRWRAGTAWSQIQYNTIHLRGRSR
eukprot:SAG31_NODE_755_length_12319_cov_6.335542_3_plen_151_part_00